MDASAMGREPGDQVQFGSQRPPRLPVSRRWAAVAVGVAAVLALAGYLVAARQAGRPRSSLVTVTDVGHRLLGVRAGWELYGLGQQVVVRIQPARGRITVTRIPGLASSSPTWFVVGRDWALIRPAGSLPGYLVRGSMRARRLTGTLASGSYLLPGPRAGELWLSSGSLGAGQMRLVALHTAATIMTGPLPELSYPLASGTGYYLLVRRNGVLDFGPAGLASLPVSTLLAVGPSRLLAMTCRPRPCRTVVIDPATGGSRVLPGVDFEAIQPVGAIAPDGAVAAVTQSSNGAVALELLNLDTGAARKVLMSFGRFGLGPQSEVWSPDSRWLFVTDSDDDLFAVNASTGHVARLGVRLPGLDQLAVWPALP